MLNRIIRLKSNIQVVVIQGLVCLFNPSSPRWMFISKIFGGNYRSSSKFDKISSCEIDKSDGEGVNTHFD